MSASPPPPIPCKVSDSDGVADPLSTTFYAVDGPVLLDFASTDGMTEQLQIKDKLAISNPAHVVEAERYVSLGLLSKSAPKKAEG